MLKKRIPVIPKLLHGLIFLIYNSHIPASAVIGKKSRFAYGGIGVVIHSKAIIGSNCLIGSNVTIGGASGEGVPKIGDNVYIATGSKVLGKVTISDNVVIGANSVVIRDVRANTVVAGVPAKLIHENVDIRNYCNLKF